MSRNPAVILYDASGNPLAVQDGVVIPANTPGLLILGTDAGTARRLGVNATGQAAIQNQPNMDVALSTRATEGTLATRASEATLATRASEATLATRASEATLATRASEATLTSIKDTDGVKKITDPLPAGTNTLGQMKVVDGVGVNLLNVDSLGKAGIQNQPNMDVALSTRATEATLATRASEATLATRASEATLAAAEVHLGAIDTDIDVALSTRASEATLATRASEATLAAAEVHLGSIDTDIDVALSTRASEATLAAADAKLATIDAVLDSIKDVDGIKKITDPLPTGTNHIGAVSQQGAWTVQQGTPPWVVSGPDADGVAPTENPVLIAGQDGTLAQTLRTNAEGRLQEVLYDDAGNAIAVVLDNSIYRLETRTTLVGQALGVGAEKKVSVIDDATNAANKRLLVESDFKPGATISIGNPPLVTQIEVHLTDDGTATGSRDMIVNGAGTPQVFYFPADPTDDIFFNVLRIVMTASAVSFDGGSWMKGSALANGILVEAIVNGGTAISLGNIQYNEDLLHLPGTPLIEFGGGGGIVVATLPFSGREKLAAGTGDLIRITIRDNFTAFGTYGGQWLQASFYGFKEA